MIDQHTIGVHGDLVRRVHRGNKIVIQSRNSGDSEHWRDQSGGVFADTAFDRSRAQAQRLQMNLERENVLSEKRALQMGVTLSKGVL